MTPATPFPPETDAIAAMIAMLERRAARVESFREFYLQRAEWLETA